MKYTDLNIEKINEKIASLPYSKLIGIKYRNEVLDIINDTATKDYIMDISLSITDEERSFIKERIIGYFESLKEFGLDIEELGGDISTTDITIALVYIKQKVTDTSL